ncbi:hypothetical protein FB567DRAFT_328542 [Paraphoma chrysanthemicola]|uniref:Uncharacterized protein n=1 Tax=Paraphoma chrysanthemicola TaxID=798071 RepID=A0A8K0R8D2_9PLEO|nr:hypothetical protein FB567DRAFT_328542 [Paraphoma chrysanthemicola]
MAYSRLLSPRNVTLFSLLSLGGGYFMIKSRTLAEKQRNRAAGDYSVTVDRSGTSLSSAALAVSRLSGCKPSAIARSHAFQKEASKAYYYSAT